MRSAPAALVNVLDGDRQVAGRVRFNDPRLRWTPLPVSETGLPSLVFSYSQNAFDFDGGIYRIASAGAPRHLYAQFVPFAALGGAFPYPWTNLTQLWNLPLSDGAIDAYSPGAVLFQTTPKTVYRAYLQQTDGVVAFEGYYPMPVDIPWTNGTPSLSLTTNDAMNAICFGWDGEVGKLGDFDLSARGTSHLWDGRLFDASQAPLQIFSVRRTENGTLAEYIYFSNPAGTRARYLRRVGQNYSGVGEVIPIDIADDLSNFRLGHAHLINNQVILTGILKRAEGVDMHVYTFGPEQFTMGRDLFIAPAKSGELPGMLYLREDTLYYLGPGYGYRADASSLVGVTDHPNLTYGPLDPFSIKLSATQNAPAQVTLELPSNTDSPVIRPGSEVVVEADIDEVTTTLGTFGIDTVNEPNGETGKGLTITARSAAGKQLAQWESDACYDYWSQTKVNAYAYEMTDLIRATGHYTPTVDGPIQALSIDTLDTDGYLYLSSKASRGGILRASFLFPQAGNPLPVSFGVGLNFYVESKVEAAARLHKDEADVSEDEYGKNGVFALFSGDAWTNAGGTLQFYLLRDSVFQEAPVTPVPVNFLANFPNFIEMRLNEGHLEVWIAVGQPTSWIKKIDTTLPWNPWKRTTSTGTDDQCGRAAVYLRAGAGWGKCYPFGLDSKIVPLSEWANLHSGFDNLLIDDEVILYSGMVGDRALGPFPVKYGNLVASYINSTYADQRLTDSRAENYLSQAVSLPGDTYITGVEILVRKSGYPEDGLRVSLYKGPRNSASPLGTEISGTVITSDKMESTFGWYYAAFPTKPLVQNGHWLVLTRAVDPYRANPNHYYNASLANAGYAGGVAQIFNDDTDTLSQTGGCLQFKLYGVAPSEMGRHAIYVTTNGTLSSTNDAYLNQALVVTDGLGKGECFQIVGYKYQSYPNNCIFYVDRDPSSVIDLTSQVKIVPALQISLRDVTGRGKSAHPSTTVHLYRLPPYLKCLDVQFYSAEEDRSVEDLAREIARKAGVLSLTGEKLQSGNFVLNGEPVDHHGQNFILHFDLATALAEGEKIEVCGRGSGYATFGAQPEVRLSLKPDGLYCYNDANPAALPNMEYLNLIGFYPWSSTPLGHYTVCFHKEHVSAWCNGQPLAGFRHFASGQAQFGDRYWIQGSGTKTIVVDVPACNLRVDNFILDMGKKGLQLLEELIGEKRYYFQDDQSGGLRLFANPAEINPGDPYELAVYDGKVETDASLVTRLRVEGADMSEQIDPELLNEYGNLYHLAHMNEINSPYDALETGAAMLEEYGSRIVLATLSGAADPRVEPGDRINVRLPEGETRSLIVDGVDLNLEVSEQQAVFDMSVTGRVPRSNL